MTRDKMDEVLKGLMGAGPPRDLTLIEVIAIMQHAVEARRSELTQKGGMRVPYHGPLSNAPPSILRDVERWLYHLEKIEKKHERS